MRYISGYASIQITPPVTAEGYDGSNFPRYAECNDHVTVFFFFF